MKKNRVIFIGDYYRGDQDRNIVILKTILSPLLKNYDLDVSILKSEEVYTFQDWKCSLNGLGKSFLETVEFLPSDVVFGFEINKIDLDFLNKSGIPWLNFEVHPIRFLDDLYFSITSSFDIDFSVCSIEKTEIEFYADLLKLKSEKITLNKNSVLIVGQSPIDKSVYFDGVFKGLNDYYDDLDQLVGSFENVYYRHHPYLTNQKLDSEILERYNATLINDQSYYDLLASAEILSVVGISSSALHEARFFGKEVFFLEARKKIFSAPISLKLLYQHSEKWLYFCEVNRSINKKNSDLFKEDFLRNLYGNWSYPTVENTLNMLNHKVNQAEAKASEAEAKASEAEAKASEAEARAHDALYNYHLVVNSNSWKVTKPLRLFGKTLRWFFRGSYNWLTFSPTSRPRRVLKQKLIDLRHYINERSSLKSKLMTFLNNFPLLKARLKRVGINDSLSFNNSDLNTQILPKEVADLSPRAKKIYAKLKQVIDNKDNKS